MAQTRFRPDRGLTVRMGLTMLLLALLYVVPVLAISQLTGALWAGILIGLGALWAQWYFSDRLALSAIVRARCRLRRLLSCTPSSTGSAPRRTCPSHGWRWPTPSCPMPSRPAGARTVRSSPLPRA